MTKMKDSKLFAFLAAVSAVILVAGVILYALLGFNTLPDVPASKTVELNYNALVEIRDKEQALGKLCEDAFKANGLSYTEKESSKLLDSSTLNEGDDSKLVYTFTSGDAEKFEAAVSAIRTSVAADADFADAAVFVSWHTQEARRLYESSWRGAIALAVGAVVALAYVAIRYGLSCGVAGLVCCAHDALLVPAFFALTRIPVYASAPLLYAAAAAFVSVVLWLAVSAKIKANGKAAEAYSGEECILRASRESGKTLLIVAIAFAVCILVLGAVAVGGTALFILPMLLSVACPLYSATVIGPRVALPIRSALDKRRNEKRNRGAYVGKKKADEAVKFQRP